VAEADPALDDLLARHLSRFQASHARARAQAGPSLFGADRAVDHWTFGHARRAIDDALADAAAHLLGRPREAAAAAAPALRGFVGQVLAVLAADAARPPARESGRRPAPAALDAVRRHGAAQVSAALAGLARGRIDPRLRPPRSRLPAALRDGRWLLAAAGLAALLLLMSSF
jgi:hypothetical protein